MTTSLFEWNPEVMPTIANVPAPTLYVAVRNACIRFCEKTHLWTNTLDDFDVDADTADYTLTIPEALYAELIGLPKYAVKYKEDGEEDDQFNDLTLTSETDLEALSSAWKSATSDIPNKYWMDNIDKQLHLYPIPEDASTEGLRVKVLLKPNRTCTTVPDFLYLDHSDIITHGVLSDLFKRTAMPWYNEEAYKSHEFMFLNGCSNQKMKEFTGPTNKVTSVSVGYFA